MSVITMNEQRENIEEDYRKRFGALIKILKSAYPNFKIIETKESFEMWLSMLKDIPFETLSATMYKHISTKTFPPSIADIREKALRIDEVENDWSAGWELFIKSVGRFGIYRTTEAIDWIREQDALAAKIILRLGYQGLCESDNQMADRAHFKNAYENEKIKEKEYKQLPPKFREAIDSQRNRQNELNGMLGELYS